MLEQNKTSYSIAWIKHIAEVDKTAWNSLAAAMPSPFFEWEWLHQIEASGSTSVQTGWLPYHLTIWAGARLVAAAPLYIKGHSAGEFVFDHIWADVAGRIGIEYYPKLVGMSPFTPMIGYRFIIAPDEDEEKLTGLMIDAIEAFCHRFRLSGCSFLFVDPQWHRQLTSYGFTSWLHQSYVWQNNGYQSFEDYLAVFNANQRRNIKRERKALAEQGITIKVLQGDEIPPCYFPLMYDLYERTNDKFGPWGCKYLTEGFFDGLSHDYRQRLVIVAAFNGTHQSLPFGMSMLVTKGDQLYGRYWGSSQNINSLHFNACYYAPIEWAISNGINRFDPGAGGPHKLRRGFSAIPNYSLHRFTDRRLRKIMQTHINEINRLELEQIDALNQRLPFANRKDRL
jgi:predicted N-acyltransferase